MRTYRTGAGEPARHRLRLSCFSLPNPRRGREDSARWRGASGGVTTTSGGDVHGSRRDRRRLERRDFHKPFPPSSGTTGVAHEPRPGKFASTSSSWPASLISVPAAAGAGRVMWRLAFYFILYPKKIRIDQKMINTRVRVFFRRYRYCQWRDWD
jgi:hypothetical protein